MIGAYDFSLLPNLRLPGLLAPPRQYPV